MSKHVHMHMCLCLDTVKESPFKEGLTYVIQLSYTPGMLYALYGLVMQPIFSSSSFTSQFSISILNAYMLEASVPVSYIIWCWVVYVHVWLYL